MTFTKILAAAALAAGLGNAAGATPIQWSSAMGGNDHYYEVVWDWTGPVSWTEARDAAAGRTHQGQSGHLATITSQGEQDFLNALNHLFAIKSPFHHGKYVKAWIGGTDAATEGSFEWITGESFAYSNYAPGEPNNVGNQDYLVGWYHDDMWDDCWETCHDLAKYVVEYETPAAVPLPAALPLLLAGIGGLGIAARRRARA